MVRRTWLEERLGRAFALRAFHDFGLRYRKLGAGTDFQLLLVPEILPEINGKFRLSRSFVQSDYDHLDWDRRRADEIASLGRVSPEARGASRG